MPPIITRVLFLYANQPDALTTRKIELIANIPDFEVALLYWNRMNSLSIPFTISIPADRLIRIDICDVNSSVLLKFLKRAYVVINMTFKLLHSRPHVVSAGSLDVLVAAVLAKLIFFQKIKLVYDLADTDDLMLLRPVIAMQKFLFRYVDQILITSKRYNDGFLELFKLKSELIPVSYVPNSPPKKLFDFYTPRSWDEEITISYIGTFRGTYSISCLVKAVEQARNAGFNISVLFAGTGPEKELVEKYSLEHDFVKYYGPYKYSEEISKIYSATNIVYACYDDSHNKRIALACRFAEAIVCGIPLIVSKGTYMAELTEKHGLGYAIGPNDVSSLVKIIENLIRTQEERNRIRSNDEKVRNEYLFDSYESELKRIYQSQPKNSMLN